jgi:hypothetical protein
VIREGFGELTARRLVRQVKRRGLTAQDKAVEAVALARKHK